jgi:hypothetical protein
MLGSSQDLNMVAQNSRRQPSSYCYGPVVQIWTTHASLQRQAWWWRRPLVMIPLSDRVPERASEASRTRVDGDGGYGTFHWWRLLPLGFSRGCEFIGGRARSVGARGAHTMGRHGWGVGHATTRCGCLAAHLRLPFGLCLRVSKIGTLAFVSSTSENISFSKNLE